MNDVQVENRRPSLVAGNSIGRFVSPPDLTYRFQLIGPDGTAFLEPVVAGGDGHTSYDLTDDLDWEAAYTWRVRAEYQGANGPWSTTAGFRTPPPPPPVGGGPYGPIRDISPQEALGILTSLMAAAMVVAPLLSGALFEVFDALPFMMSVLLMGVALWMALSFRRRASLAHLTTASEHLET